MSNEPGSPGGEPPDRWDWLWTTLRVIAWFVVGLVALVVLLGGLCMVIFSVANVA